ncbi:hypothetical protein PLESTB_001720500 [Pleodorina starrii]|uniref:EfeO-type cupredoxin-like domain-containing protein n=1 Tax=Pleodorina starrii TaxID=330485 RepID=A0A9W6F9A9_9CHLO|nr:hypothetical protein PLESTM_001873500 [Pleodorina starrii]GLC61124.1 hypothetical protein PLESTB_001720500 [Pleodorina starrii]GLC69549.1 hypothetical protein PLESTF_000846200 [Pleodorina starrii]
MQALGSSRSRLSHCRSARNIPSCHSRLRFLNSSPPRLPCAQPSAALGPGADIVDAQREVAETQVVAAKSRRQALGILGAGVLALTGAGDLASPGPVLAALKDYKLDPDDPIEEVAVQLGTEDGEFVFEPSTLEFTAGRIYKLKLRNPSAVTHYFTAFEFAEKVFSIMVLAGDPAVEVKGGIQEVALKAGASATWVFMPIKPGKYPLRCTVKGHDAMRGQIVVKRPQAAA